MRRFGHIFDFAKLDAEASTIALVDADGAIAWVNAAWRAFGEANGAEPAAIATGVVYLDAVQGPMRRWFVEAAFPNPGSRNCRDAREGEVTGTGRHGQERHCISEPGVP